MITDPIGLAFLSVKEGSSPTTAETAVKGVYGCTVAIGFDLGGERPPLEIEKGRAELEGAVVC